MITSRAGGDCTLTVAYDQGRKYQDPSNDLVISIVDLTNIWEESDYFSKLIQNGEDPGQYLYPIIFGTEYSLQVAKAWEEYTESM